MELKKTFETAYAPERVWQGLSDVRLVAGCLPGASIVEELGPDEYKGKLAIKVGPLAASFAGLISIERRAEERVAIVTGKGADAKSSSRVNAKMTYRVQPAASGTGSQVDIESDISLAGALAQFGKAAVMQEIANRMTDEFVRRFEAQLAQMQAADVPAAATADVAPATANPATATADARAEAGTSAVPTAEASVVAAASTGAAARDGATAAQATPPAGSAAAAPAAWSAAAPQGRAASTQGAAARPAGAAQPAATQRPAAVPAAEPVAFDAGNMLWSIFKQRLAAFFRKLFG